MSGWMTHNLPHSHYRELKNSTSLKGVMHLLASEGHAVCFGLYVHVLLRVSFVQKRFHISTARAAAAAAAKTRG